MNMYEQCALQEYLTDFPWDCSYEQILLMVEREDDRVIVWEPFTHFRGERVIELIDNLKDTLERNFIPRKKVSP